MTRSGLGWVGSRVVARLNVRPISQLAKPPVVGISTRRAHDGEGDRVLLVHAFRVKVPVQVGLAEGCGGADVAVVFGLGGKIPVTLIPIPSEDLSLSGQYCPYLGVLESSGGEGGAYIPAKVRARVPQTCGQFYKVAWVNIDVEGPATLSIVSILYDNMDGDEVLTPSWIRIR